MIKTKEVISILFLLFLTNKSFALVTGNILLPDCNKAIRVMDNDWTASNAYNAPDTYASSGICLGFIEGVNDMFVEIGKLCPDSNVSYTQSIRIVLKFLKNNPDKLNFPAYYLVYKSLSEAYPCKK